jgi:hypothetical protein
MTSLSDDYPGIKSVEGLRRIAFRTEHPRAMPNREFAQVTEYLRAAC